jgi:hypothetical protein
MHRAVVIIIIIIIIIIILTHMTITRQRLGKHIPEVMLSTVEGHSLPDNWSLNTFPQQRIDTQ